MSEPENRDDVLCLDGPPGLVNEFGMSLADPALERQLIGSLMVDPEAFAAIADHVFAEDFFDIVHRRIFAAMRDAYDAGYAVGAKLLTDALGGDPNAIIDGNLTVSQFIARLMADADTSIDIGAVAEVIHECADRRAAETADDREILDANAPFVSRMGLKMWVDQNDPGPEYEYLIEDLIPERQGILLMGESQTGKSFLAYHMAMCGARAVPFFGRRILRPFGTVWCAYEAAEGASARMRAYRRHHGLPLDDLPFAALQRPLKLWPEEGGVDAVIAEIKGIERAKFRGAKLGMVIIDTHNAGNPGASEIDSEVVSKIRDRYHKIIGTTGAALVIVGHTNSQGKHRGNEQLGNNIDTIIRVSLKTKTIGRDVIQLKDDDGRDIRTLRVIKQREGQSGDEHDFVLRAVEDGTKNKFGRARTSCVITPPNLPDTPADTDMRQEAGAGQQAGVKASKQEVLFLQCILDATASHGVPPPADLGLPHAIGRVVDYDIVKKMMSDRMMREDDDTPEGHKRHRERVKSAVRRAREGLTHVKVVAGHAATNHIWWTGRPVRGMAATQPKQRDLLSAEQPVDDDDDLGDFA